MGNVQHPTHVHATVVILKTQRTARIVYQFAVHPVPMENVQLPKHAHAIVVILRTQRTAQIVYQFAVLPA
jgi:sRNA-binding regulator protein Hfq